MMQILEELTREKEKLENFASKILVQDTEEDQKQIQEVQSPLEKYILTRRKQSSAASVDNEFGESGGFVGLENVDFDYLLNLLIGIRRSLNNYSQLKPGQRLTDWQFQKQCSWKNDWISQSDTSSGKQTSKMTQFKFIDYAPEVFSEIRKFFGITE